MAIEGRLYIRSNFAVFMTNSATTTIRTTQTNKAVPSSILNTIGHTPLIELQRVNPFNKLKLYGKLESFNPGGSVKDRTSNAIIRDALENNLIKKGDTIIESSSGNMAIGLAQTCLYHELNLIIVADPKLNIQTERILLTYGVIIEKVLTPSEEGGFLGSRLKRVKELLTLIPNSYWTNQYSNALNPLTHEDTMSEICKALNDEVDYVFIATSTCGTLMGCSQYIKRNNFNTKIIAVDAIGSFIFNNQKQERLIPGHGSGTKSNFLIREMIHDVVHVSDQDCIRACWNLLNKEAILCGGSSGAVLAAYEKYCRNINDSKSAVLILCDRGERYLETIYNRSWISSHFPDLEL